MYYPNAPIDRFVSQAVHSGDWLNVLPMYSCGLRMGNDVTRPAPRLLSELAIASVNPIPAIAVCWRRLRDAWTVVQQERCSAGRQLRHYQLNDIIWRSLSRANIPSTKEPLGLYRTDAKRPDGVTLKSWQAWTSLLWDATSLSGFFNIASHV